MKFPAEWSLIALAALALPCSALSAKWWHAVKIGVDSTRGNGRLVEFLKVGKETCVAMATLTTWSDLFCYQDGRCLISEVKVAGDRDDSAYGPAVPCWTKHACLFQGVGYNEGETFVDKCLPFRCQNHSAVLQLPAVSSSCNDTFTVVPGVGCVNRQPHEMTWCDPRAVCRDYGGQLVSPEDFLAFGQRLARDDIVWIGIRGRKWADRAEIPDSLEGGDDSLEDGDDSSPDGPFELICEIKINNK
ncbi:uncharacterized protein [Penaeus vannamei]|uniref:uncharacterized protein n=1 Tax=Penaeus vannamei TaxID=6689 RepID=UPI00387F6116